MVVVDGGEKDFSNKLKFMFTTTKDTMNLKGL